MRLYVPLSRESLEALRAMANEDMRPLKDMAAVLLVRALQQQVAPPAKDEAPTV